MNNQLQVIDPSTDLLGQDSEQELVNMAAKLIKYSSGGSKLNQHQAAELAVYALMVQGNPFNKEVYMTPTGPMDGVKLYRRKALEWMHAQGDKNPSLDIEPRPAKPSEAVFDPEAGDIAIYVKVYASIDVREWETKRLGLYAEFVKDGMPAGEAANLAAEWAGEKPYTHGVGVVRHDENFSKEIWKDNKPSGEFKPEMWDRHERAEKRAAKAAIQKRFPSVIIPKYHNIPNVEDVVYRLVEKLDQPRPNQTEQEIIESIGVASNNPYPPGRKVQLVNPAPDLVSPIETIDDLKHPEPVNNPNSWSVEQMEAAIQGGADNEFHAANALKQSRLVGFSTSPEHIERWMKARVKAKEEGHKDASDRADQLYAQFLDTQEKD